MNSFAKLKHLTFLIVHGLTALLTTQANGQEDGHTWPQSKQNHVCFNTLQRFTTQEMQTMQQKFKQMLQDTTWNSQLENTIGSSILSQKHGLWRTFLHVRESTTNNIRK